MHTACACVLTPLTPNRKETLVDRLLRSIYKAEETRDMARQAASNDKHRQRLLKRYSRISAALHSHHPWAILAPMRQYTLDSLIHRLERNMTKHRHRAVSRTLHSLRRQHRHTSLSEVYKLFDTHYPPRA